MAHLLSPTAMTWPLSFISKWDHFLTHAEPALCFMQPEIARINFFIFLQLSHSHCEFLGFPEVNAVFWKNWAQFIRPHFAWNLSYTRMLCVLFAPEGRENSEALDHRRSHVVTVAETIQAAVQKKPHFSPADHLDERHVLCAALLHVEVPIRACSTVLVNTQDMKGFHTLQPPPLSLSMPAEPEKERAPSSSECMLDDLCRPLSPSLHAASVSPSPHSSPSRSRLLSKDNDLGCEESLPSDMSESELEAHMHNPSPFPKECLESEWFMQRARELSDVYGIQLDNLAYAYNCHPSPTLFHRFVIFSKKPTPTSTLSKPVPSSFLLTPSHTSALRSLEASSSIVCEPVSFSPLSSPSSPIISSSPTQLLAVSSLLDFSRTSFQLPDSSSSSNHGLLLFPSSSSSHPRPTKRD